MKKKRHPWKAPWHPGCDGKVRFPTLTSARAQVAKFHGDGIEVQAYACMNCEKFHVGHRSRAVKIAEQGARECRG